MPIPFLSDADFRGHQTITRVLELRPTAPNAVSVGQEVYDTTTKAPLYFDGAAWRNPFARGDHTGTQPASTITGLPAAVLHALAQTVNRVEFKITGAHIAAGGPGYATVKLTTAPFLEAGLVSVAIDGRSMSEGDGWRVSADQMGIDVWLPSDAALVARYQANVTYSVTYYAL